MHEKGNEAWDQRLITKDIMKQRNSTIAISSVHGFKEVDSILILKIASYGNSMKDESIKKRFSYREIARLQYLLCTVLRK